MLSLCCSAPDAVVVEEVIGTPRKETWRLALQTERRGIFCRQEETGGKCVQGKGRVN
jgi:hypothetical protein